jgi:hypothetical protein
MASQFSPESRLTDGTSPLCRNNPYRHSFNRARSAKRSPCPDSWLVAHQYRDWAIGEDPAGHATKKRLV